MINRVYYAYIYVPIYFAIFQGAELFADAKLKFENVVAFKKGQV